ncbi:MAG TPA: hypothetical protein VMB21_02430 [Candidatus Limnocylindria bacterium]|nr:hypothetical protein [Candidatus Limnocylindria bacterium]
MTPNRILPDLQCSLLCDDVRQEVSGNLIILGVISLLRVPGVPIAAPKLCLINRWTAGVGQFTEQVRILSPDGTTVLRKSSAKLVLPDPSQNVTNVSVFGNMEFPVAGVYYVEVLVDDVMKLRYPVPLVVVPQPGQPTA